MCSIIHSVCDKHVHLLIMKRNYLWHAVLLIICRSNRYGGGGGSRTPQRVLSTSCLLEKLIHNKAWITLNTFLALAVASLARFRTNIAHPKYILTFNSHTRLLIFPSGIKKYILSYLKSALSSFESLFAQMTNEQE